MNMSQFPLSRVTEVHTLMTNAGRMSLVLHTVHQVAGLFCRCVVQPDIRYVVLWVLYVPIASHCVVFP